MSREIAAGNDPQVLNAATVLLIGAGAVGTNIVQTLALAGVGGLDIVDDDVVALSNLTRSPLYKEEDAGRPKADVLANRAREISFAPEPRIRATCAKIEDLGLGAFEGIDVVIAAVDSLEARVRIADFTRLMGVPLVEIGFDRSVVHQTVWANRTADAACFRCLLPTASSERASCSMYAAEAIEQGFLPAMQTAAAIAANLAAEAVIRALHGEIPCDCAYFEVDIAQGRSQRFIVRPMEACPGVHRVLSPKTQPSVTVASAANELLAAVPGMRTPTLLLREPFLVSAPCATCGADVTVHEPLRRAARPRCEPCRAADTSLQNVLRNDVTSMNAAISAVRRIDLHDALARLSLQALGYGNRDVVEVCDLETDRSVDLRLRDVDS